MYVKVFISFFTGCEAPPTKKGSSSPFKNLSYLQNNGKNLINSIPIIVPTKSFIKFAFTFLFPAMTIPLSQYIFYNK